MPRVEDLMKNSHGHGTRQLKRAQFSRLALVAFAALFMTVGVAVKLNSRASTTVYYVSTDGADTNAGTLDAPWRTVSKGLTSLAAGDTLMVRGGTYAERIQNPVINAGTATAPVTVKAYPGERPVVSGLLWLKGASYWTLDGINVTWGATNLATEHMTKMTDGTGWRITNAEIWGAHSFAGLLVAGAPSGWRVDHNVIHDTYLSNDVNQDHLIYVNTNATNGSGTIERNVLYNSPNGRGIKVGPPSSTTLTPNGAVTIRFNTLYNNLGPSNIQLSYGASSNVIYRNIMQKSGSGKANVTWNNVSGTGNRAYENIGFESSVVTDPELTDPTNQTRDPQFINAATYDFHPQDVFSQDYGRYAPGDTDATVTPVPETTPTPAPAPTPTPVPTPAPDTTAPSVPTNLSPTSVTTSAISFSWTPSTDDTAVVSYDVSRSGTKLATVTVPSYSDTGLTAATTYAYSVTAKDAAGNVSAAAAMSATTLAIVPPPTADKTAPTAPTGLKVAGVNATSVSLSWKASTDNVGVVAYNVYRSDSTGPIAKVTTTSFLDKAVTKGKSYTYKVKALDAAGNESAFSNSVKATPR